MKKDVDEFNVTQEEANNRFLITDEAYAEGSWIFNQIRDVALVAFGPALTERISPLLTHPHHSRQ